MPLDFPRGEEKDQKKQAEMKKKHPSKKTVQIFCPLDDLLFFSLPKRLNQETKQ